MPIEIFVNKERKATIGPNPSEIKIDDISSTINWSGDQQSTVQLIIDREIRDTSVLKEIGDSRPWKIDLQLDERESELFQKIGIPNIIVCVANIVEVRRT